MAETWHVSKLTAELRFEQGIPVIEASGECDLITSRKIRDIADQLISSGHNRIIFDLRGMTYIDSSGFRVLLDTQRKVDEKHGNIALVCLTTPVERVFHLLHLEELLITSDSVENAIAKLQPK